MGITNVLASLAVADQDAAHAWYGKLFGRDPDARPMDGLAEWHLTAGGGVQVFHDPDHAGTGAVTIVVDDLPAHVAALVERGIDAEEITTGQAARFAAVADPDGNTITFAEQLGS